MVSDRTKRLLKKAGWKSLNIDTEKLKEGNDKWLEKRFIKTASPVEIGHVKLQELLKGY